MTKAIFPDFNDPDDIRRKNLHEQFYHEITQLHSEKVQLVVFTLENLKFAIEIEKVDEVVVSPKIHQLPKSPAYVPGIADIRGTDIVILDLALKLGLTNESDQPKIYAYTIVVASQRFTIGILTNEIPTNIKIAGANIQPTGLDISGSPEDETYIKGIITHNGDKVYFIDIDELLEGDRTENNK
ncbi:MAG: chemotaxis protein CheW [Cyclobacteriaceae bacterium]